MTLNENTIRELLEQATPGQWTVEDDGYDIIVGNAEGHRMGWGDQVRFKFEAGDEKHDPALAALAPELARDWLRMRREFGYLERMLEDFAARPDAVLADAFAAELIHKILNGEHNA